MVMRRNRLPAAALVAAVLLFTGACGAKDDAANDTSPTPSATSSAATKLIEYDNQGVVLQAPEDVTKLKGAPEDFKQFISGAVSQMITDRSAADTCDPNFISVFKVDPAGYAVGAFECGDGGGVLMWAKVDGTWRQILDGQSVVPCDLMKKYSVPKAIVIDGKCDDGGKGIDYAG